MTMDAIFNYDERVILNMFATPNKADLQVSLMRSQQYADSEMEAVVGELLAKIEDMSEVEYELLFSLMLDSDFEQIDDSEEVEDFKTEATYNVGYLISQEELEQLTTIILKHYAQLATKLQSEDPSLLQALANAFNSALSGNEATILVNAIREIFNLYDKVLETKQDDLSQLMDEVDQLYAKIATPQEKDKQKILSLSGQARKIRAGGSK